jgi:predicted ATPase
VAALGELNRQGTSVLVGPLNQAAVAAQAAMLSGAQPAAEAVAWLYRASGGNPFFVEQLVRWSATGDGAAVPGELPVSAAVRRVVGERLAGLGDDARRVVTVAAVAGEEVDQEVLATVAGLPPGRFADAVAEAVAAGILWRRFSEHPACGFVHTLLREAARAMVDAEVRRGLHLELATVLEALPGRPGRLADVAHHRRAALPAGDPQVMVDATAAAAEAALRVFAHEVAVAQCTAGFRLVTRCEPGGRWWRRRHWPAVPATRCWPPPPPPASRA